MSRKNGDKGYEEYKNFLLTDGTEYRLSLYPYAEEREGIWTSLERSFSTKDRDRNLSADNCAGKLHGAGWYNGCGNVNLLGKYCPPGEPCEDGKNGATGHYYQPFAGLESLKSSRMMLR
ncbi:ficolin-1-like [Mercenaria mercenaria]|uniref:ficolin-1-like n=1 Tax=Mercenaria mercenaria TaxID=6596 RepID=UPI00234FA078|nr:ficolin-1-like [Mercenaria mercenaria]